MKRMLAGLLGFAVMATGALMPVDAAHAKKKKDEAPAAATTDIDSCAKLSGSTRDTCISRSRPVTGAALYRKWAVKNVESKASEAASKAKAAVAGAAEKAKAAIAGATEKAKGMADKAKAAAAGAVGGAKSLPAGATNIDDCGKVDPSLRDQCISRSKPVKGDDLYKKWKK